jgi:hypothetical protein
MVRALLEGRKTQTRRRISFPSRYAQVEFLGGGGKDSPDWDNPEYWGYADGDGSYYTLAGKPGDDLVPCRYGRRGDLLWVRETWTEGQDGTDCGSHRWPIYAAEYRDGSGAYKTLKPWNPSIFMPRKYSRLMLELTDVRVERLQDISREDALAEGMSGGEGPGYDFACHSYQLLWKSLHGEGSWDANPWVWSLTFRVHRRNVDAMQRIAA